MPRVMSHQLVQDCSKGTWIFSQCSIAISLSLAGSAADVNRYQNAFQHDQVALLGALLQLVYCIQYKPALSTYSC